MGVSIPQLQAILTTKLIMDDRRVSTLQQARQQRLKPNKPAEKATLFTVFISALMGCFYLFCFSIGSDYTTKLTFYFSFFIVILSVTLISDFTSVLIDVRDNYIILPKPVTDRTVVLARLLHIFIHICKIVVPMCLPAFIFLWIKDNSIAALIFLVLVLFVTLFTIFLINAVYIIILRITTPQKFNNVISYIQIFFAIISYASYQVFPRMVNKMNFRDFDVSSKKWILLAPSYWFASAFNLLFTFHTTPVQAMAAIAGIVFPVGSMFVVVKYLAPAFNQKLSMISGSDATPVAVTTQRSRKSFAATLASLVTTNKTERTGFLFAWKMTGRSRDFKVRVYPGIGYMVVLIVAAILGNRRFGMEGLKQDTMPLIFFIYLSRLLLMQAIMNGNYSDKYKAAWMFLTAPVKEPGQIISGSIKAMIIKFYSLLAVAIIIVSLVTAGPSLLPNVLLAICNQLLISYCVMMIGAKSLPFSQVLGTAQKSGQFLRSLGMMAINLVIALLHYLIHSYQSIVLIALVVSLAVLFLLMSRLRHVSWAQFRNEG